MEENEFNTIQTRKVLTEKFPPFILKQIFFEGTIENYSRLKDDAVRERNYELAAKFRDLQASDARKFENAVKKYYSEE